MAQPGITREHLQSQIDSFESQRQQLLAQLHQVEGGLRTCRGLVGKLEREAEARAATPDAPPAATEG